MEVALRRAERSCVSVVSEGGARRLLLSGGQPAALRRGGGLLIVNGDWGQIGGGAGRRPSRRDSDRDRPPRLWSASDRMEAVQYMPGWGRGATLAALPS